MWLSELSRAVAMKALAADVAARLQSGEKPDAIRAQLLAEGYPPEVVDHVFATCEYPQARGGNRTVLALVVSAVLLLALPLVGATGGAWAATALTTPAPEQEPNQETIEREIRSEKPGPGLGILFATSVGMLLGGGTGLALALLAAKTLSEWSIDAALTDDVNESPRRGHDSGRWPHGIGIVGRLLWRSLRTSFGRSFHHFTNRTSCFTASSYAWRPFSGVANSASPSTPLSE